MKLKTKMKGQSDMNLGQLPIAAIAIVVFIIIVALGTLIISGMNDSVWDEDVNMSAPGAAQSGQTALDILGEGNDGMADFAGWTGTLVVVVIAGVILAIVLGLFYRRSQTGGMT